jgi:hypothetical protein
MFGKALLNIASVCGAVLLFVSWAFQQTLLDKANGRAQALSNAQAIYQTYQSNNALFNAVVATLAGNESAQREIRRYQISNYALGLQPMENLLEPSDRTNLPGPVDVFSGDFDYARAIETTQTRLEAIQNGIRDEKNQIEGRKARLRWVFLTLYGLGTLVVLLANSIKALRPEHPVLAAGRTAGGS